MPAALTSQLIDDKWDAIDAAVKRGLELSSPYSEPPPALDKTVVLNQEALDGGITWSSPVTSPTVEGASSRVRTSVAPFVAIDIQHRFHLGYDAMTSPDLRKIEAWAFKVREFELQEIMKHYLRAATGPKPYTAEAVQAANPQGWLPQRCVLFKSEVGSNVPRWLDPADLDGVIRLDIPSAHADIQALLFRMAGGPYVRRAGDILLSWMPSNDGDDYGVDLLLTEQLQIVNLNSATVVGVQKDRPAASSGQ